MKIIYYLLLILFINNNVFSKSLFDTDFHEVNFFSNDIESDKIKNISDLKFLSFHNLLNNIMIKKDFLNIKNNLDEDLINTFIQNIIIEDEKIINNNYYSKIKINFNKNLIIDYFIEKEISYIDHSPEKFLLVIYDENDFGKNFLSKNNVYYKFIRNNKNVKFNDIFTLPNLDFNDRYIINQNDLGSDYLNKINLLGNKYNSKYKIFIHSKNFNNINNIFIYLISNDIQILIGEKKN